MQIMLGDSLNVLKTLPENSVDAVVTDPPYGWRFMGKAWDGADIEKVFARDKTLPDDDKTTIGMAAGKYDQSLSANKSFELWTSLWAREALRVLKPGGHMLVFCGPRTYHRMASGVEDAGFEIRDQLQWIFGSGFPKSMDVSKAIDKAAGAQRGTAYLPHNDNDIYGEGKGKAAGVDRTAGAILSEPAITADAIKWQGFGTALKPANEPIVLARKPLSESTVAKNVLKWGVGALNIDGSRIAFASEDDRKAAAVHDAGSSGNTALNWNAGEKKESGKDYRLQQGRWPANVIFDEAAAEMLDQQSGVSKSVGGSRGAGGQHGKLSPIGAQPNFKPGLGDIGGASRFFYCAKASKAERNRGLESLPLVESGIKNDCGRGFSESDPHKVILNQNHHPTVKPIKLMEYLVRLVTQPGGVVLDPFMGSGSTGVACKNLGFHFIGIEMSSEYVDIANNRLGL